MEMLRRMLQISPQAQMVLEGETIRLVSPEAARLFPTARADGSIEALLGDKTEEYRRFSGAGSMLFSATVCGLPCDVTVTELEGYRLVTLSRREEIQDAAEVRSSAQQLRESMAGILVAAPRLFPLLEETPETLEYTASLNQGFFNILRITENMELYARQMPTLQHRYVEAEGWFAELAQRLTPLCEAADRKLVTEVSGGCGFVQMDAGQMNKAVLHLISNAIKFTEPGGTITLTMTGGGNRVRICVRDDGAGIPEDQMGSVFGRSHSRGLIPDPKWGAGLGLTVVRNLVQAHGGSLMIQSQTGKGTAVYLTLPARRSPDTMTLRSPVLIPESNGIDPFLVVLSDVLPASVFDTRGVDL